MEKSVYPVLLCHLDITITRNRRTEHLCKSIESILSGANLPDRRSGILRRRWKSVLRITKDFQIKHMGHRIELGEIETALETVEGLGRSLCMYDEAKG